jgi:hypothetical protein
LLLFWSYKTLPPLANMSPHSRASSNSSDLPMVETAQRARAESLIAEEESLKHKEAQSSTLSLHPAFYIL